MLKNRALQVKLVNTKKDVPAETMAKDDFRDKVAFIATEVRKSAKSMAIAGAGYIVLDTLRQVTIIIAKK